MSSVPDYGQYIHGQPYLGASKTGRGFKEQYDRWLASKAAYYSSNNVFTELGTANGYSVGVKGITDENLSEMLDNGVGYNLNSQLVLSEADATRLLESANTNNSLSSWDSWFAKNDEALKFVDKGQWAEIQQIFEEKKSKMTEEFLQGKLEDGDKRLQDNEFNKAVQQGKYLENRVNTNIMDGFQTPMYHIRFFMIKREKVIEMHKSIDENVVEKSAFKFLRPEADDIVVIAETGATDLIIDDLEIENFSSTTSTFADTSFNWTITEPGSITLLDRISAAKVFCDYAIDDSDSEVKKLASGDVPYYMELSLRGYEDDIDDVDEGSGSVKDIIGPFIFELGYVRFDMTIGPEGAVYNFSAHPMDAVAEFSQFARVPREINISGSSLPELLDDFNLKLNNAVKEQHKGHEVDETKLNTYIINYDGVFKDPSVSNRAYDLKGETNTDYESRVNNTPSRLASEIDPDGDGRVSDDPNEYDGPAKGVEINPNGIDAFLYADPSKIIGQSLHYNPFEIQSVSTTDGGVDFPRDEFSGEFDEGYSDKIKVTLSGYGSDKGTNLLQNWNSDVGGFDLGEFDEDGMPVYRQKATILDPAGQERGKTVLTAPEEVRMIIEAETPIPDAISSIMALSYDLVKKGTRLQDPENPEGEVNKGQTFIKWFRIGGTVNFDYSKFSEASHSYKATIEYRLRLFEESRTDIGLSSKELSMVLDDETTAKRIQEMGIVKEYMYYFTGLNDQIINFDLTFDEAFVLRVPIFGKRDHKAQLAYASSSSINIDEASNVSLDFSPNEKVDDEAKKSNILNFFTEVGDLVDKGGETASELRASIGDIASGLGFDQTEANYIAQNIQDSSNAEVKKFQEILVQEDIAQELVNAVVVKGKISEQSNTTTSSDNQEVTNGGEVTNNIPLFASEIVPGLEGNTQNDPRVAEGYKSVLEKDIARNLQILKRDSGKNKAGSDVPAERGSIRQTSFAHLMDAHNSGAKSTLAINMELRGDPWYMGKANFYDGNNDEGPTTDTPTVDSTDLLGISYSGGSNQFLLVIESPRKLDFDISDEDKNTGLYSYEHLNYSMSGIYHITSAISKFSGGMYTTDITAFQNQTYNFARILAVKNVVEQRLTEIMAQIGDNTVGSGDANFENDPKGTNLTFSLSEPGGIPVAAKGLLSEEQIAELERQEYPSDEERWEAYMDEIYGVGNRPDD